MECQAVPILIKPDAVHKQLVQEINHALTASGLAVFYCKLFRFDKAATHRYQPTLSNLTEGKDWKPLVIDVLVSGVSVCVLAAGYDALAAAGAVKRQVRELWLPGGLSAHDKVIRNLMHTPDSESERLANLTFFFPEFCGETGTAMLHACLRSITSCDVAS